MVAQECPHPTRRHPYSFLQGGLWLPVKGFPWSGWRWAVVGLLLWVTVLGPGVFLGNAPADDVPPIGIRAPGGEAIAMTDEVKAAVTPLFKTIRQAKTLRSTANMRLTAALNGKVLQNQTGNYQIFSQVPNRLLAVLKGSEFDSQLIADSESMFAVLSPEAYIQQAAPASLKQLASDPETLFEPFPEYILSLTISGGDPFVTFFRGATGMGVSDGQREDLPETTRVHVRRADGVVWDLWVRDGDQPAPVRLAVNLTENLQRLNSVNIPEGFSLEFVIDFKQWQPDQTIDAETFRFTPQPNATMYSSLEEYIDSLPMQGFSHPLLGQPAPEFTTKRLDGKKISLQQHRDKEVVVLDFWATWCGPCVEALPQITKVTNEWAERGVVFYAVNIDEEKARITAFLKELGVEPTVLLDPEGRIAGAYGAEAIPQTVLIGKDGRVEAVHVGFGDVDGFGKQLADQLETLVKGQRLFEPQQTGNAETTEQAERS